MRRYITTGRLTQNPRARNVRRRMDIYDAHALNDPQRTAVVSGGARFSWDEWARLANRAANRFKGLGIEPGDRALVVSPNSWQSLACTVGLRKAGAITVPLNPTLTAVELEYVIQDADPALIVTADSSKTAVVGAVGGRSIPIESIQVDNPENMFKGASDVPIDANFSGYMLYTSGTSGRPKAAFHSTSPDASVAANYIEAFRLRSDDVHLVAGPMYHSAPAAFCWLTLSFGGTAVVMPKFDPVSALALIEAEAVTTSFMAPILLKRILDLPRSELGRFDVATLRVLIVAGSHCPFELKVRAQEVFGDVLFEFYGSTETKAVTFISPEDQLRKPGSCGTPMRGVSLRVLDAQGEDAAIGEVGEILVRHGPATFESYWSDPGKTEETIREGWIATGDLGYQDQEGFLYIVDRKGAVVISGGVNIYPAEIESALLEHPKVSDAAVIGLKDEDWGERLHALVVRRGEVTGAELEKFLREKIAGYKVPRSWEFVSDLGRTDDGKLRKAGSWGSRTR